MSARHAPPWIAAAFIALLAGCQGPIDAGGTPGGAAQDDDPLAVPDTVEPGTLDALHRTVIQTSCAGQQGLCHYGQFEPNLSTPALTYENLVLRPSLEKTKQVRVVPGNPSGSVLIDKLRNRDVISQMPLGAEPLPDEHIAAIEAWIQAGALRRPGAEPAPVLNNPPREPEIAIFNAAGERLGGVGQAVVHPGEPLTFRMSAEDFETEDSDMYIAVFQLITSNNRALILEPQNGADGVLSYAEYDPAAPEGTGDLLNYRMEYTFPDTVTLLEGGSQMTDVPAAGLTFSILAAYADEVFSKDGMLVFSLAAEGLRIEP